MNLGVELWGFRVLGLGLRAQSSAVLPAVFLARGGAYMKLHEI